MSQLNSLPEYLKEQIILIQERSTDQVNPFNLLTPRHSFIILKTSSGKIIKCEYHHTGKSDVDYEYQDWVPSITVNSFGPKKPITVQRIVSKFHNIAHSQQFNEESFNCQQFCRVFLKKTCKTNTLVLRNDYLRVIERYAWESKHERFFMQDPWHYKILSDYEKNNEKLKSEPEFQLINTEPATIGLNSPKLYLQRFLTKAYILKLPLMLPSFYNILIKYND